jgi:hypothetical protein
VLLRLVILPEGFSPELLPSEPPSVMGGFPDIVELGGMLAAASPRIQANTFAPKANSSKTTEKDAILPMKSRTSESDPTRSAGLMLPDPPARTASLMTFNLACKSLRSPSVVAHEAMALRKGFFANLGSEATVVARLTMSPATFLRSARAMVALSSSDLFSHQSVPSTHKFRASSPRF